MVKRLFSTHWKSSTQPRKQRKYRYNAPLHVKQKMLHVHLAPSLRSVYGTRQLQVRKGDKVRILRGQFRKKEGKVERVNLKRERVFVHGVELVKHDGTKVLYPLAPSNLLLIDLDLSDKKRKGKLERAKAKGKEAAKKEMKGKEPKEEKQKSPAPSHKSE